MNTPEDAPEETIKGINAADLLARGLESAKAATGNPQAWQPPTPEELAALLPQYEIESLLGRGGMGAVYRGKQAALDRAVAIKLLPAELAADAEFMSRFQREARTLAKLQHPGIVAVHDFGQTSQGHLYFVMEFVNGTDLSRLIHGPGVNSAQALEIIAQVCEALQYAHGQGVIHRDIKPANVLINTEGRAKLADFGLARPTSEETASLTRSNVVMGTPDYMAPEQMAGNADHRADLYALGVMLYEMLTGQTPRGAWAPPSQRVQVDVRLDQVVVRALQQDPAMRYQQASEIKTDVDVIRTTPLPKAGKAKAKSAPEAPGQRTTPLPKAKKPVNRLTLAAMVVLPLLALAGWWVVQQRPESMSSDLPWQRIELSAEEWMKAGLTLKDGWVHNPGRSFILFDRLSAAKAASKFAVRAKVKFHSVEDALVFANNNGGGHTWRKVQFWSHKQSIINADHGPSDTQRHVSKVELDEEASVELLFAGDKVYTRFNKQPVVSGNMAPVIPWERCFLLGASYSLRDIEYAILDGIPDPLKALGWEVPQENASKPALPTPAEAVLKARERGGRLRVFGNNHRGPVELGKAAEFDDFRTVVVSHFGWAARREGGDTYCMAGLESSYVGKAVELGPFLTSFLQRDKIPVMQMRTDGSVLNLFSNGGSQHRKEWTDHRAVAFLNPGNYILSLDAGGKILHGEHWYGATRTDRISPPDDFFLGARAYTTVRDHYIAARPGLPVRSFNAQTGQVTDFPSSIQEIVEMDATADRQVIMRDASGQVFVVTPDGKSHGTVPPDVVPAVAVRAGTNMFAAQKRDGTWHAWGESDSLVAQTAKIGSAIDVDFHSEDKGKVAYMLWIEPVDGSAAAPPASTNPTATAEAKKRIVEARAHLKAGEAAEARKITEEALATAPGDLATMAEAALLLAEAQAPERAALLAGEFVKQAPAEHPQFAAITELRVKLTPTLKQYQARLDAAAKLVTANDDAGEQRELQTALQLVSDGREAAARLEKNPLHIGRPLPGRRWAGAVGHTYVPVDGLANVLFSIWETRVKDFEQFVKETGHDMSEPRAGSSKTLSWKQLGFEQTGDHPVVMVSRADAEAFCQWLTKKERASGRLLPGQVYRLPTDREWSAAMGVLNEPGDFPENRQFPKDVFTWEKGTQPPRNAENCSWKNDDFPNTAPVGSGLANRFGLYDIIGNVKEICADPWAFNNPQIVLRGGSFRLPETWSHQRDTLSGGFVGHQNLDRAKVDVGFRCVLDLKSEAMRQVQTDLEAALEKFHQTHTEGGKRVEFTTLATDEMVLLDMTRWGYPTGEALGLFAELPVTHFFVHGASLRKPFDALKKMPLRVLSVDNLFPEENFLETVRGLPLQWLMLKQHPDSKFSIKSLAQLEAMKLKELELENFKSLENFEPLRGMPLEALHLRGSTPPVDLKPLQGAPLILLSVPKDVPRQWLLEASAFFPRLAKGLDFSAAQLLAPVKAVLALGNDREAARLLAEDEKVFADRLWWSGEFGKSLRDDYGKMRAEIAVASLVRRAREGDFAEITRDAKVFNGHAYLLVRGAITFDDGQRAAQALGGHLVTITSKEENDFIKREFMTAKDAPREILIGARREGTEGGWHGWKWVTGEDFPFTDWFDPVMSAGTEAGLHVGLHAPGGNGKWWYTTGPRQAIIIEWDAPTPQPK